MLTWFRIIKVTHYRIPCHLVHFRPVFMGRRQSPGRDLGAGYQHLALGLTFAAGVVFFTLVGVFLDRRLGATPLFTLIGTATGATLSFLNVYWKLRAEAEERRKEKSGEVR